MDFFGVIVIVLLAVVVFKFLSFLVHRKKMGYQEWAAETKRQQLLETVRQVRREQGDYSRRATRSVPSTKKAAPRARPAARRRK